MRSTLTLTFGFCSLFMNAQDLLWTQLLLPSGDMELRGMVGDGAGNFIATGYFTGSFDFDPGPGDVTFTAPASGDGFLAKYDAAGGLLWAKQFTSDGIVYPKGIALDPNGNIVIAGNFVGTTQFDPNSTAAEHTALYIDAFVCMLDPSGNHLWEHTWGNGYTMDCPAVTVSSDGTVAVALDFPFSLDLDPGEGVANYTGGLPSDAFLLRLEDTGSFLSAEQLSTLGNGTLLALAADASGNIFAGGLFFNAIDLDGIALSASSGITSGFLVKYDATGAAQWAYMLSGSGHGAVRALSANSAGDVVVGGDYSGTIDLDLGPGMLNVTTGSDEPMLFKLNSAGSQIFGIQLHVSQGFSDNALVHALALAPNGEVWVTGELSGTIDLDPGAGISNFDSALGVGAYIGKYGPSGDFLWGGGIRGEGQDIGRGLVIAPDESLFWGGEVGLQCDIDPSPLINWVTIGANQGLLMHLGSGSTSIAAKDRTSFELAPNPVSDRLTITLSEGNGEATMELLDAQGRIACSARSTMGHTYAIDMRGMETGVYLFRVTWPNGSEVQRVVKD